MPVKKLPSKPSLDHLRHQAKDLRLALAAGEPAAAQRLREFHPRYKNAADTEIFASSLSLSDAQLAIAREHGFAGWARLKAHIEGPALPNHSDLPLHEQIEDMAFRHAVKLLDAGDAEGVRACLNEHPELKRQRIAFEGRNYFRNPSLLDFIAENPIRHGKLPSNIVEVAAVILDNGVDHFALNETLGLVCTGKVPRECNVQRPLIDLLCDHGADPGSALLPAVAHEEFEAAAALIGRGAHVDLPVAAALGQVDDCRRYLPSAGKHDRHLALALAAQFCHEEVVELLLDAGEDPNRYNPTVSHAHATPLHQAALAGCEKIVRLLAERGARLDLKDILWNGTPADWAAHAGNVEVEAYLRDRMEQKEKIEP